MTKWTIQYQTGSYSNKPNHTVSNRIIQYQTGSSTTKQDHTVPNRIIQYPTGSYSTKQAIREHRTIWDQIGPIPTNSSLLFNFKVHCLFQIEWSVLSRIECLLTLFWNTTINFWRKKIPSHTVMNVKPRNSPSVPPNSAISDVHS